MRPAASITGPIWAWRAGTISRWPFKRRRWLEGLLNRAVPIVPIRSAEYPTRARRPAFSVLDTEATRALLKVPAQHWRHNLRTMLDELRAA